MPLFSPVTLTDKQVGAIFVQASIGKDLEMETRGSARAIWLRAPTMKTTSIEALIELSSPPERPTATLTWRLRPAGWLNAVVTLAFAVFFVTRAASSAHPARIVPVAVGAGFVWLAIQAALLIHVRDSLATRLGLMA